MRLSRGNAKGVRTRRRVNSHFSNRFYQITGARKMNVDIADLRLVSAKCYGFGIGCRNLTYHWKFPPIHIAYHRYLHATF